MRPAELQSCFHGAWGAPEYASPGLVTNATVPSVFLKYLIPGLEDGGLAFGPFPRLVKNISSWGRGSTITGHYPILYG